jgi:hypothetical protein
MTFIRSGAPFWRMALTNSSFKWHGGRTRHQAEIDQKTGIWSGGLSSAPQARPSCVVGRTDVVSRQSRTRVLVSTRKRNLIDGAHRLGSENHSKLSHPRSLSDEIKKSLTILIYRGWQKDRAITGFHSNYEDAHQEGETGAWDSEHSRS